MAERIVVGLLLDATHDEVGGWTLRWLWCGDCRDSTIDRGTSGTDEVIIEAVLWTSQLVSVEVLDRSLGRESQQLYAGIVRNEGPKRKAIVEAAHDLAGNAVAVVGEGGASRWRFVGVARFREFQRKRLHELHSLRQHNDR